MYPGYGRPQNVLDEYAITFFSLLNEGYRIRNQHYLMIANLLAIPRMEDSAARKFLTNLEFAATDPDDILRPNDGASSMDEVRKFFQR